MADEVPIRLPEPGALAVALAAFRGMQRGAATGNWDDFSDLMAPDVRIMVPVPPHDLESPDLMIGREQARAQLDRHHAAHVAGVRLSCHRAAANGDIVMLECRAEGRLGGEVVANQYVFTLEIRGDRFVSMYHYALWTARRAGSGWNDPGFARDAFADTLVPVDEQWFAKEGA